MPRMSGRLAQARSPLSVVVKLLAPVPTGDAGLSGSRRLAPNRRQMSESFSRIDISNRRQKLSWSPILSEAWERIRELLLAQKPGQGRQRRDDRKVLCGILWVMDTGF